MSELITPEAREDDDIRSDIELTRTTRREIVKTLLGTKMPEDPKALSILLQTLDGIDRSAIGRLKIKADKETGNSVAGAASIVANALAQINPAHFKTVGGTRDIPTLPENVETPEVIPGQVDIGTKTISYQEVMDAA